jgi:hypothetical protein
MDIVGFSARQGLTAVAVVVRPSGFSSLRVLSFLCSSSGTVSMKDHEFGFISSQIGSHFPPISCAGTVYGDVVVKFHLPGIDQ